MRHHHLLVSSILLASTSASAGPIQDRLSEDATFSLTSQKPPTELEFCIADVISSVGVATALRDGPNRLIIVGTGGLDRVIAAVELNRRANLTQVISHIQGRGWDDRLRERVARCL